MSCLFRHVQTNNASTLFCVADTMGNQTWNWKVGWLFHVPKLGFWHWASTWTWIKKYPASKSSKKRHCRHISFTFSLIHLLHTHTHSSARLQTKISYYNQAVERLEEKAAQMNCSTQAGAPPPSRGKKAKKERATICDLVMVMPTGRELEQQQCVRSIVNEGLFSTCRKHTHTHPPTRTHTHTNSQHT